MVELSEKSRSITKRIFLWTCPSLSAQRLSRIWLFCDLFRCADELHGSCAGGSFSLCRQLSLLHSSVRRCDRSTDPETCLESSGSKFWSAAGGAWLRAH